jgi:hypothetical protein
VARNLIVCLDGTRNEPETGATNVVRLYGIAVKDRGQLAYYDLGVGTIGARDPHSAEPRNESQSVTSAGRGERANPFGAAASWRHAASAPCPAQRRPSSKVILDYGASAAITPSPIPLRTPHESCSQTSRSSWSSSRHTPGGSLTRWWSGTPAVPTAKPSCTTVECWAASFLWAGVHAFIGTYPRRTY